MDGEDYSAVDQWFCRPTFNDEYFFLESSSDCSVPLTPTPNVMTDRTSTSKPGPTGKISKRKSRRSTSKSQTTFIYADPANFRQMVQQVTGLGLIGVESTAVVQNPNPLRGRRVVVPSTCMPTLDTSALFLINRDPPPVQDQQRDHGFFDLDTVPTSSFFADLESWCAI